MARLMSNTHLNHIRRETEAGRKVGVRDVQALLDAYDGLSVLFSENCGLTDRMILFIEREGLLRKWHAEPEAPRPESADDDILELKIFLCRGGGVELIGVYQEHGERGPLQLMIAGDDERIAKLREVARGQMRAGVMSDFRLCRFLNVETLEVIGRNWEVTG